MKRLNLFLSFVLLIFSLLTACDRQAQMEPIPVTDIPTAMKDAFESAPQQIKAIADRAVTAIEQKNYPLAYHDLETLKAMSDLDAKQQQVVERAMLTVA